MVNTRTDAELAAAVQAAVDAMLPQIREQVREEYRTGAVASGSNPPPVTIHTWLERFNKQKPRSFEKAVAPVDAENWISHMEKIFDVMDCNDAFKTRLAVYKFEGDALAWWKAYKQAKGGDDYIYIFLNTFVSLCIERILDDEIEKVKGFLVDTLVPFHERLRILGRVVNVEDLHLSAPERKLMNAYNKKPVVSLPQHELYQATKFKDSERLRPEELNQQNIEALLAERQLVQASSIRAHIRYQLLQLLQRFAGIKRYGHGVGLLNFGMWLEYGTATVLVSECVREGDSFTVKPLNVVKGGKTSEVELCIHTFVVTLKLQASALGVCHRTFADAFFVLLTRTDNNDSSSHGSGQRINPTAEGTGTDRHDVNNRDACKDNYSFSDGFHMENDPIKVCVFPSVHDTSHGTCSKRAILSHMKVVGHPNNSNMSLPLLGEILRLITSLAPH
ncbi:hypothetical protein Tco_0155948 [Tanacetum coccineum]